VPVDRSRNSHAYENLVEHVFLADLLRQMWYDREEVVEVAKAQVDSWGYDLVLTVGSKTRHVQLKTSVPADVSELLIKREGGCVVAVLPSEDAQRVCYRVWEDKSSFSNLPNARRKVYRRGSEERQKRSGHRKVSAGLFSKPMSISGLCEVLFPANGR
jgi:hypothetical protein